MRATLGRCGNNETGNVSGRGGRGSGTGENGVEGSQNPADFRERNRRIFLTPLIGVGVLRHRVLHDVIEHLGGAALVVVEDPTDDFALVIGGIRRCGP